ncbi:MAG: DUF934 domain-containing protein [Kofleriaceae bacterium]|nr:DUF934 domain-containing protein [Kofleriaceae bacterium]
MQIIRDRAIVDDDFVHVADGAEPPAQGKPIVSFARYVKEHEALHAAHPALGVRVPADKLPEDIPELSRLALIALELTKFTEGRPFSVGRMLRQRHGFKGELRAVGYVLRDALRYLERCGFNAFELKEGKPLPSALEAFGELPLTYQADALQPLPIYRRR